jgi:hypothetical protein
MGQLVRGIRKEIIRASFLLSLQHADHADGKDICTASPYFNDFI